MSNENKAFLLDATAVIDGLQFLYQGAFNPAPPGIYIHGFSEPVMVPGKNYYKLVRGTNGNVDQVLVPCDPQAIDCVVYDANGDVVVPAIVAKRRMFDIQPTVPVQETNLVKEIVQSVILRSLEYLTVPADGIENTIREFLQPHLRNDENLILSIIKTLDPIIKSVNQIVRSNSWSTYFVDMRGKDVYIEQGLDYRIQQYYVYKEQIEAMQVH